jgi:hypothetical protein
MDLLDLDVDELQAIANRRGPWRRRMWARIITQIRIAPELGGAHGQESPRTASAGVVSPGFSAPGARPVRDPIPAESKPAPELKTETVIGRLGDGADPEYNQAFVRRMVEQWCDFNSAGFYRRIPARIAAGELTVADVLKCYRQTKGTDVRDPKRLFTSNIHAAIEARRESKARFRSDIDPLYINA